MSTLEVNTVDSVSGTSNLTIGSGNSSQITLKSGATLTNFPENTPAFLVKKSSNQTIASATTTLITWDTEVYDTNSAFGTNSFTVPSGHAGKYIIYCTIHLQGGSADNYFMNQIMVNNTLTQYNILRFVGSGGINNNIVASLDLSVGDYVTIKVLHNTGSNKDIDYNKLTWFGGYRIIGA